MKKHAKQLEGKYFQVMTLSPCGGFSTASGTEDVSPTGCLGGTPGRFSESLGLAAATAGAGRRIPGWIFSLSREGRGAPPADSIGASRIAQSAEERCCCFCCCFIDGLAREVWSSRDGVRGDSVALKKSKLEEKDFEMKKKKQEKKKTQPVRAAFHYHHDGVPNPF
jgi:hypothetical protein